MNLKQQRVQGGTGTGKRLEQYVMEQRKVCGVSGVLSQDTPTKTVRHYDKGHRDDGKRGLWI